MNENYFKNECLIRRNDPQAPDPFYPKCEKCNKVDVEEEGDLCPECETEENEYQRDQAEDR
jgi:hypothetical protein